MLDTLFHRIFSSLKYRIAAIIFLLEAGMMAAVLGVTLNHAQTETEKQLAANEEVMIQLIADLSRIALITSEYDELQPYIEQVVRDPHVRTILLADRRDRVVVSNKHEYLGKQMPGQASDEMGRWLTQRINNYSGKIGTLAIRFSRENLMETSRKARALGITIALIGMTVIAIVGVLIGYLLTRRLDALSLAAKRIASGDLAVHTGLSGVDEVAVLGQAFDTMARSVADNVEALKHATDLLEQRVAERTRELADAHDEAVNANRSKTAFLANMSHEIRTPLAAIIGFSEMLLDTNQSLAERIDAIRTIIRSSHHLLGIINDILDVSKVEADKVEVENIPVNPFEVLDDVQAIVSLLTVEKGLQFHVDYTYPLPTRINSDPLRLKQILINLCNNAIKFTAHGSVRIKVTCEPSTRQMMFKVIDTGIGMTAVQIATAFNAFTQADASTTRRYGGTGLGLYLSKQLANKLGGDISVESAPDVGSAFTLTVDTGELRDTLFVAGKHEPEPAAEPLALDESAVSGNVLLAEDNIDNQKLVALYLRRVGASVATAENGQEAIAMALARPYDLIFMDLQMPVLGGIEATRKLRQKGYRGPIVALTANATKEDTEACTAAGCDDFISKPVQRDRLNECLARYLKPRDASKDSREPIKSSLLLEEPALIDLVAEFVKRLPTAIREIKSAFDSKDAELVKQRLHSLKGSSGNFGYDELFRLCQTLEFEVAKANPPGIAKLLGELDRMAELIGQGLASNVYPLNLGAQDG
jgi:signal transduction histidine kinase/response regulator of citrate/malate metabolism